ncbi:uncharacterized RNA methyltransferase [Tanacetum coccineum]
MGGGGPNSKVHLIHSVWANFQTSTNNVIFGNRWRHILGERDFWEHVGGIDVYLAPSSFGQANTRAFDSLLQKLHKYVPLGASVTDLYAGARVIGLPFASTRKCRKDLCVEINKESKLDFEKTIEWLPSSLDSSISWHHADTSLDPLSWLVGSDVLVVDPPRKGLDPALIGALRVIKQAERKAMTLERPTLNVKDEKRPWILRAREDSVNIPSRTIQEESRSLPQTLIYISCGWRWWVRVVVRVVVVVSGIGGWRWWVRVVVRTVVRVVGGGGSLILNVACLVPEINYLL